MFVSLVVYNSKLTKDVSLVLEAFGLPPIASDEIVARDKARSEFRRLASHTAQSTTHSTTKQLEALQPQDDAPPTPAPTATHSSKGTPHHKAPSSHQRSPSVEEAPQNQSTKSNAPPTTPTTTPTKQPHAIKIKPTPGRKGPTTKPAIASPHKTPPASSTNTKSAKLKTTQLKAKATPSQAPNKTGRRKGRPRQLKHPPPKKPFPPPGDSSDEADDDGEDEEDPNDPEEDVPKRTTSMKAAYTREEINAKLDPTGKDHVKVCRLRSAIVREIEEDYEFILDRRFTAFRPGVQRGMRRIARRYLKGEGITVSKEEARSLVIYIIQDRVRNGNAEKRREAAAKAAEDAKAGIAKRKPGRPRKNPAPSTEVAETPSPKRHKKPSERKEKSKTSGSPVEGRSNTRPNGTSTALRHAPNSRPTVHDPDDDYVSDVESEAVDSSEEYNAFMWPQVVFPGELSGFEIQEWARGSFNAFRLWLRQYLPGWTKAERVGGFLVWRHCLLNDYRPLRCERHFERMMKRGSRRKIYFDIVHPYAEKPQTIESTKSKVAAQHIDRVQSIDLTGAAASDDDYFEEPSRPLNTDLQKSMEETTRQQWLAAADAKRRIQDRLDQEARVEAKQKAEQKAEEDRVEAKQKAEKKAEEAKVEAAKKAEEARVEAAKKAEEARAAMERARQLEDGERLREEALMAVRAENYHMAVKKYSRCIDLLPEAASLYCNRASAYIFIGSKDCIRQALEDSTRGIEMGYRTPWSWRAYAMALYLSERYEESMGAFENGIRLAKESGNTAELHHLEFGLETARKKANSLVKKEKIRMRAQKANEKLDLSAQATVDPHLDSQSTITSPTLNAAITSAPAVPPRRPLGDHGPDNHAVARSKHLSVSPPHTPPQSRSSAAPNPGSSGSSSALLGGTATSHTPHTPTPSKYFTAPKFGSGSSCNLPNANNQSLFPSADPAHRPPFKASSIMPFIETATASDVGYLDKAPQSRLASGQATRGRTPTADTSGLLSEVARRLSNDTPSMRKDRPTGKPVPIPSSEVDDNVQMPLKRRVETTDEPRPLKRHAGDQPGSGGSDSRVSSHIEAKIKADLERKARRARQRLEEKAAEEQKRLGLEQMRAAEARQVSGSLHGLRQEAERVAVEQQQRIDEASRSRLELERRLDEFRKKKEIDKAKGLGSSLSGAHRLQPSSVDAGHVSSPFTKGGDARSPDCFIDFTSLKGSSTSTHLHGDALFPNRLSSSQLARRGFGPPGADSLGPRAPPTPQQHPKQQAPRELPVAPPPHHPKQQAPREPPVAPAQQHTRQKGPREELAPVATSQQQPGQERTRDLPVAPPQQQAGQQPPRAPATPQNRQEKQQGPSYGPSAGALPKQRDDIPASSVTALQPNKQQAPKDQANTSGSHRSLQKLQLGQDPHSSPPLTPFPGSGFGGYMSRRADYGDGSVTGYGQQAVSPFMPFGGSTSRNVQMLVPPLASIPSHMLDQHNIRIPGQLPTARWPVGQAPPAAGSSRTGPSATGSSKRSRAPPAGKSSMPREPERTPSMQYQLRTRPLPPKQSYPYDAPVDPVVPAKRVVSGAKKAARAQTNMEKDAIAREEAEEKERLALEARVKRAKAAAAGIGKR
ncbi:hypothetical protein BJ508DRAFT_330513 [Ascobolus immersus RN42]|uniref:Uncharacterized protein n=1 Tax=Ascobolus immersus RN42 TaxID=1160509 RepID=A0A3N4HT88_ASCIM|nr:hypothetical protein BJ508DRAFT_330513 [Ascobolus immersus RN42]